MADQANPLDALTSTPADAGVQPPEGQGSAPAEPTTPSAVQPEQGQGQADATTGLYDLSTVPEELRPHAERIAKDIDRNVNAKLQEFAGYRKQWEPYEQLGLHEADPEGVKFLLDLAGELAGDDPKAALLNLAETLGVDLAPAPAEPAAGDDDPNRPLTRAEFEEWQAAQRQAAEDERAMAAAYEESIAALQAEYAEVEKAHGKPFADEEKDRLISLAKRFQADHDEPIKAAYELITSIAGGAEKALVSGQPKPPAPAEPTGRASTAPEPVTDFATAERIHRERNASIHA